MRWPETSEKNHLNLFHLIPPTFSENADMTSYLEYHLVNGFIHNWLVAGPRVLPIQTGGPFSSNDEGIHRQVFNSLPEDYRLAEPDWEEQPCELAKLISGGASLAWRYIRCMDDHLVDLTTSFPRWNYFSAWAYTVLRLPSAQKATLVFAAHGPAAVWVNDQKIFSQETINLRDLPSFSIEVDLKEGENQVLVQMEMVGVQACPFRLALQVKGLDDEITRDVTIALPTLARYPRRHEIFEETFEQAYLEEVVNHRGAHINLRWAKSDGPKMRYAYQMQDKDGFVYVEGTWETDSDKPYDAGHGFRLRERPFFLTLRPIILEYFEHNLRYEKKLPIYVIDNAYKSIPSGTFGERNREALEDAAKYDSSLYAEIAKLALGQWSGFKPDAIMEAVQQVNRREAGSQVIMLGLLGLMYRYMNAPQFPTVLSKPLEDCVLNYRYWKDEGLAAAWDGDGLAFNSESDSLLFHACETLAGQLYPQHVFSNSGQNGDSLRLKGEQLALEWLRQRGAFGFQDWDSNETFEKDLLALTHLSSLIKDPTLSELSAVMIDKILFQIGVNSFKGAFGSTHGRTSASMIKSAQLEATSGISRMLWGTGVYNSNTLGTVSLATSGYEFPLMLGEIANDPGVVWNHERHVVDPGQGIEVNKATFKTPDYMLCSAQDYRPGERGSSEHIWQATLGPDAVVFGNHPACVGSGEEHQPGFWLGNNSLPRVAQWKDFLVAIYHLPENDWMGFTHAYFPVYQFSEYEIKTDKDTQITWAMARKDNGYLALAAARGFELIQRAPDGFRELRSYGQNNIWVCQMGRAETDVSFERFKKRVLAMKVDFHGLEMRTKTLRGEFLSFGWEGPLIVNGKEKPLHGYRHHESQYSTTDLPATLMDIQYQDTIMRLNFS